MSAATAWRPLAAPLAFVVGAIGLQSRVVESPEQLAEITRGIVGPATWPVIMMWAIALFGALWALQRIPEVMRARADARKGLIREDTPSADALSTPFSLAIGLAIVFILLYGYLLAVLGFAASTLIYIIGWCWLGGMRRPLQIGLIGVLGTTALLYLFVKLASMPLNRGQGVMGEASIALYRLMGIY
jgi:putative tricarboxylic transport membrane protein